MGESHHRLPRPFRQAAILLTDQLLELRPGWIQLHAQPVLSLMANAWLGNALLGIDPRGKLTNDRGRPGLREAGVTGLSATPARHPPAATQHCPRRRWAAMGPPPVQA